jgi:hypothetical protein
LAEILRTSKLEEIENGLSSHVKQYLGYAPTEPLKVQFGMPSHRDLFEKYIGLQVVERSQIPPLPIDRMGDGYRALLRVAVLQTLCTRREMMRRSFTGNKVTLSRPPRR